ncbi:hypothetical protein T05_6726 [Trichinella murrelli]|uniref:Uncharacterized protein n=1 Tax=Trichinella murrelli TaxID=144512 RepID=A0A0V0UGM3_9BILA|nr:hypothetical protein T05_6726 [Trichinella murrelli]
MKKLISIPSSFLRSKNAKLAIMNYGSFACNFRLFPLAHTDTTVHATVDDQEQNNSFIPMHVQFVLVRVGLCFR